MDDALAHKRLSEVLELIDQWGNVYDRRWGHEPPHYQEAARNSTRRSGKASTGFAHEPGLLAT